MYSDEDCYFTLEFLYCENFIFLFQQVPSFKSNLGKLQQGIMHINIDSVIFNNRKTRLCGKRPKERSTVYTSNNSLLLQNAGSPKEFKFWRTPFTYYVCHAKHCEVSLTPLY